MPKVLVFGATGLTGCQLVPQALAQGHTVTAFVRDPQKLRVSDERLVHVVTGDTTRDESTIADAVQGQDVVVSTLGRSKTFKSDHLIERSMRLIVPAMERAGVKRLILVSALGVGDSHRQAPWFPRIMYRLLLGDIFRDKKAGEDLVTRSTLDWTFVYPVLLTDDPLTAHYRVGERLELRGMPKVSRSNVAHFILNEIVNRGFVRKIVVISN